MEPTLQSLGLHIRVGEKKKKFGSAHLNSRAEGRDTFSMYHPVDWGSSLVSPPAMLRCHSISGYSPGHTSLAWNSLTTSAHSPAHQSHVGMGHMP
eukprot:6394199-Pyramimonas_sp.AAC.2